MYLTTTQWELVAPLVKRPSSLDPRGRKRVGERVVLEGVLFVLKTGIQWSELPKKYGAYQTVHRRYQEWVSRGVFVEVLRILAEDLEKRGELSLEECFIDGTFASAKKGGLAWVPPSAEKAVKSWRLRTKALFRSPSMYPVLLQAKSHWWKKRLSGDLRKQLLFYSSETKRMIATR